MQALSTDLQIPPLVLYINITDTLQHGQMTMPPTIPDKTKMPDKNYRGVTPGKVSACMLLMRLGIFGVQFYSLGGAATCTVIIAVFLAVEMICPACYNLFSLVIPLFMAVHALLVHGNAMFSLLQAVLFLPITTLLIGIPMSICLHRYFSHQAFSTSRGVQFILAIVSTLAFQGGPLWWATLHTRHHKNCDTVKDPHSIVQDGFWYSFIGWMINPKNYCADFSLIPPTLRTPEVLLVQKIHPVFPIALCLLVKHACGYRCMLWSVLLPMLLCRLITCLFNLEFHPVSKSLQCQAVNDARILARLVGESCHEDHHKNPRRCKRPDLDLAHTLTLAWMAPLGLVWDCR